MSHTSVLAACWHARSRARICPFVSTHTVSMHTDKSKRSHKRCRHTPTEDLTHTAALGWYVRDLATHCLFNFKKLRQGWEHLGQQGHLSLSKSYATSRLVLSATLQAIVFEIFPLSGSKRAASVPLPPFLPSSQAPLLLSAKVFQDCTIVYLFLFIYMHSSQAREGKMLSEKGKEKDHIFGKNWMMCRTVFLNIIKYSWPTTK